MGARDDFKPAKKHSELTTGEVVKMLRELKGMDPGLFGENFAEVDVIWKAYYFTV